MPRPLRLLVLAAFFNVLPPHEATPTQRGITGAPQILKAYNTIFDGRFNEVPNALREACGPAPPEACLVLDTVALWWQIQMDPLDRRLDESFQARVEAAIAATEMWTAREPERGEAWLYRGGAYGARVQWRVLRGERLAAARDGKRIKDALERALKLDPALYDAWVGIGLYHYYAAVAPAAARFLGWLLLLPGGNRAEGLEEIQRGRAAGSVLRSEADYQLHILYLWYEKRPEQAIALLQDLQRRHGSNPHFLQLIAEIQDGYLHDPTASLRSWRALFEAARAHTVNHEQMADALGRLGMARQLDQLFETDLAIEHLRALVDERPSTPFGVMARAQIQLGQALDRLGRRTEAVAAYRAARAAAPATDPLRIAEAARAGLRSGPSPTVAQAYRLSLEGWRALERGQLGEAARALGESLALRSDDSVTRYRQARLLMAQKKDAEALGILEAIVRLRAQTPPTIYAAVCSDAAQLHEQRGSRARAIELYTAAQNIFGADREMKEAARRAAARLAASAK